MLPIILGLLLSGCQTGMTREQRSALAQAAKLYQQKQVSPALYQLNRLIAETPQSPEVAEAYYLRGLCQAQMGQLAPAAQDFRQAFQRGAGRTDLAARARASLAMIHYGWRNWEQAALLYGDAVEHLPNQPPTDVILFYAGNAMQRAGRWEDSKLQYSRILWAFPRQPIAREARLKCYWRYNYFSIQVGAYSESERAEMAVRQFAARGLDTWQEAREGTQPNRWAVLTGRYTYYNEALTALPRVRQFQADAHIVP